MHWHSLWAYFISDYTYKCRDIHSYMKQKGHKTWSNACWQFILCCQIMRAIFFHVVFPCILKKKMERIVLCLWWNPFSLSIFLHSQMKCARVTSFMVHNKSKIFLSYMDDDNKKIVPFLSLLLSYSIYFLEECLNVGAELFLVKRCFKCDFYFLSVETLYRWIAPMLT